MARYEPITKWRIPSGVVPATLRGVLRAAREGHEGGAFWLGSRDYEAEVRSVVLLEGSGVTEERGYWEVSPVVYGIVGEWAAARDQALLAVVHSHEGSDATWLSWLDERGGVHIPDVLAVIVPAFGRARDPRQWGFHRFESRTFMELGPAELEHRVEWLEGDPVVVRASEDGILDV